MQWKVWADNRIIGTENNIDGLYVSLTGSDIATYSSAITKSLTRNSNTAIVRALYPATIQEKGLYVSTADLDAWYPYFDKDHNRYYGFTNPRAVWPNQVAEVNNTLGVAVNVPIMPQELVDSSTKMTNPCYLEESATIPFKPTFLVGLLNDSYTVNTDGNNVTITPRVEFNMEADIGVTFRGLRKAPIIK